MSSEVAGQSDAQPVIDVRGVSKDYRVYTSPGDRFKQAFAWGKRQFFKEFKALDDVSLSVMPGEMVGIIGRNGSGKSTLLQIIAGTLAPTRGEVSVRGRVAGLARTRLGL
jgi:lipopolysaccharide transport system ATP-binding protein